MHVLGTASSWFRCERCARVCPGAWRWWCSPWKKCDIQGSMLLQPAWQALCCVAGQPPYHPHGHTHQPGQRSPQHSLQLPPPPQHPHYPHRASALALTPLVAASPCPSRALTPSRVSTDSPSLSPPPHTYPTPPPPLMLSPKPYTPCQVPWCAVYHGNLHLEVRLPCSNQLHRTGKPTRTPLSGQQDSRGAHRASPPCPGHPALRQQQKPRRHACVCVRQTRPHRQPHGVAGCVRQTENVISASRSVHRRGWLAAQARHTVRVS